MMMVVGEEGTSLEDFVVYLKGELLDSVYLQQDGFDPVAASCDSERQEYTFKIIYDILFDTFSFNNKEEARKFFNALRQLIVDWNYIPMEDDKFKEQEKLIEKHLKSALAEKAVA